jgi:hypothetical protein
MAVLPVFSMAARGDFARDVPRNVPVNIAKNGSAVIF